MWAVLFDEPLEMMWCQWNTRVQHFNITYKLGGAETSSEYLVGVTRAGSRSLHIIDLQYLYHYCCTDKGICLGHLQMLPKDIS